MALGASTSVYISWALIIHGIGYTMPPHIKDEAATDAVRRLARVRSLTLTEAVRVACEATGPKPSRVKVGEHRVRLRAQGLRPIQIWVPDARAPAFRAEAHRRPPPWRQAPTPATMRR